MKKLLALGLLVLLAQAGAPARAVDPDEVQKAIDKGVSALRRMQPRSTDGVVWQRNQVGASALVGLTLLECDVKPDDPLVQQIAAGLRKSSLNLTHTYSISLAILFFDRLGDADDVSLIESLMVRLLGGQDATGGWSYTCPAISQEEVRRLQTKLDERKELRGRRELPKPEGGRRTVTDLPEEIRKQLAALERGAGPRPAPGGPGMPSQPSDNSNTQFAALALWVGRRHGLPVENAVTKLDRRFRDQQLADGGWGYIDRRGREYPYVQTTATMTCAGVLSLAVSDGATLEHAKERKPDAKLPDISKDANLTRGLQLLGTVIQNPTKLYTHSGYETADLTTQRVGGRSYYFLWSLERVAVALGLETIGKKDWYGWGAEVLLANQQPDGTWRGEYIEGGADTCFALLFLKRANLARDLTSQLKTKIRDPGERVLRGGGDLGPKPPSKTSVETPGARPITKPLQDGGKDPEVGRLTDALVKSSGARQDALLKQMQTEKGSKYTAALAAAIPQLEGDGHRKAREALADRLSRMKDETLGDYVRDEDPELRRAAALAVAMKESKTMVPALIGLLRDPESGVVRAAHAALKELTGQDFGPAARATREERDEAALKWERWWQKQK